MEVRARSGSYNEKRRQKRRKKGEETRKNGRSKRPTGRIFQIKFHCRWKLGMNEWKD